MHDSPASASSIPPNYYKHALPNPDCYIYFTFIDTQYLYLFRVQYKNKPISVEQISHIKYINYIFISFSICWRATDNSSFLNYIINSCRLLSPLYTVKTELFFPKATIFRPSLSTLPLISSPLLPSIQSQFFYFLIQ